MSELKSLFLRDPRLTLAVAESVTCGRLQAEIGSISGASEFFLGGITAYTIAQKVRHLGVDRDEAARVECVSDAVARQMARGVCTLFGSDVGAATTGYAEAPAPDRQPFAHWAIARRNGDDWVLRSGRIGCLGMARDRVQRMIARVVLAELVAELRSARAG